MATPPKNDPPTRTPSAKEQRAQKRAAQLEAFKKREAARKRNRLIGIVAGIVALVLIVGGLVAVIVVNANPAPRSTDLLSGDFADRVQTYSNLDATHTQNRVSYPQSPPVGGPHNPVWLNCGVYDQEQQNEHAVHSLEHGAVWITYDPATTSDAQIAALRDITPSTYAILSPYPGLGAEFAISAWGAQMFFTDPSDPAVQDFITAYWRSADAPEPNAPCTGALDGPGKVS